MVMKLEFVVLWVYAPLVCWMVTSVSEDRAASIFTVHQLIKLRTVSHKSLFPRCEVLKIAVLKFTGLFILFPPANYNCEC